MFASCVDTLQPAMTLNYRRQSSQNVVYVLVVISYMPCFSQLAARINGISAWTATQH